MAWKINVSISIALALIMVPFGKVVLHLFVSGDPTQVSQVLAIAYKYLLTMCLFLPVLYTLHIYRSSLQGMGDTFWPMVSGIAELVMRVLVAIFLPMLLAEDGIYYAEVTAWIGAVAILLLAYRYKDQHLEELY